MLRAVKRDPVDAPIVVPADLDDVDCLLELRANLEEVIREGSGDIVLDCRRLMCLSTPVLGWLVDLAARLHRVGRHLVLYRISAELLLQLRTLGPELPGIVSLRAGR